MSVYEPIDSERANQPHIPAIALGIIAHSGRDKEPAVQTTGCVFLPDHDRTAIIRQQAYFSLLTQSHSPLRAFLDLPSRYYTPENLRLLSDWHTGDNLRVAKDDWSDDLVILR